MEQTGSNKKRYAFAALITAALFAVQYLSSYLAWYAACRIDFSSFDKEKVRRILEKAENRPDAEKVGEE